MPFRLALGDASVGRALSRLNGALIRFRPQLFSYQAFVVAQPKPSLASLLAEAEESSALLRAPATPYPRL